MEVIARENAALSKDLEKLIRNVAVINPNLKNLFLTSQNIGK